MDLKEIFPFLKGKKIPSEEEQIEIERNSVKDWLNVTDIQDGIVHLNNEYVKIIEVIPINFKLKSRHERKMLVINYRSFLKACKFPMQISVQCRKANVEPHIIKMEKFYQLEKNENVKHMLRGYINLVKNIGDKGAITRRYFIIIPYTSSASLKHVDYAEVIKQFSEKVATMKEFLLKCGNEIVDKNDIEFTADILYSYLNKRSSEVQKLGKKLLKLMGTFLDAEEEKEGEFD